MSYAVYQYFLNGGTDAVIVRVVHGDAEPATFETRGCPQGQHWVKEQKKCIETPECPQGQHWDEEQQKCIDNGTGAPGEEPPKLILEASDPGVWAKDLKITVMDDINKEIDTSDDPLYNIVIEDTEAPERFYNISSSPNNSRFVTTVLKEESNLVRVPKDNQPKEGERPYPVNTPLVSKNSGSDGDPLVDKDIIGSDADKTGIYALDNIDHFNMLCILPYNKDEAGFEVTSENVYSNALKYCEKRHAMLIIDSPGKWKNKKDAIDGEGIKDLGRSKDVTLFFPAIIAPDPLQDKIDFEASFHVVRWLA